MIYTQPKIPLAGLDPAIHVFPDLDDLGGQDVDARTKSGQSVLNPNYGYASRRWLVSEMEGLPGLKA